MLDLRSDCILEDKVYGFVLWESKVRNYVDIYYRLAPFLVFII